MLKESSRNPSPLNSMLIYKTKIYVILYYKDSEKNSLNILSSLNN